MNSNLQFETREKFFIRDSGINFPPLKIGWIFLAGKKKFILIFNKEKMYIDLFAKRVYRGYRTLRMWNVR